MKKNNLKSKIGIEIEMVSVAVNVDFSGKGIATNLTRILKENAIKHGYKIFYAECTSHFSYKAIEKEGGEVKLTLPYKDWKFKPGCCSKPTYPFAKA